MDVEEAHKVVVGVGVAMVEVVMEVGKEAAMEVVLRAVGEVPLGASMAAGALLARETLEAVRMERPHRIWETARRGVSPAPARAPSWTPRAN